MPILFSVVHHFTQITKWYVLWKADVLLLDRQVQLSKKDLKVYS